MSDKLNVSIAINEAYIPYAYVMLTSLFENNKDRDVRVYIMYGNIQDESLLVFEELENKYHQEIVCLQVSSDIFPDYLPRTENWTLEVYYRLLLQDLLPKDVHRILQLDVDIIIDGSLSNLYDRDFNNKSLIACPDISVQEVGLIDKQHILFSDIINDENFLYFNAGVMLLNIDKLRNNISFNDFLMVAKENEGNLFAQDQDLLNLIFHGDVIYEDPYKYNAFAKILYNKDMGYDYLKKNVNIVHFAGRKPWTPDSCRYNSEKLWWEYAKLTPYYTDLIEQTFIGEMNEGYADANIRRLSKEKDELFTLLNKLKSLLPQISSNN